MITLYQFQPALGVRNPSPFCLKLETYLRMVELPYQVAEDADLRKAPKKKFPYIQDGDRTIADSSLIIDYLKATYGDPLDNHFSLPERGIALACQRLMEEHLYWSVLYSRWGEDEAWQVIRKVYFSDLPPVLRAIAPGLIRKAILRDAYGHGMCRHQPTEIYAFGKQDIKALSDFLRDKPFLMGDKPTSLDATGYGFLTNLLSVKLRSELSDYAHQFENLTAYCDRMEARYWS